jgi:hypothetical protein
MPLNDIPRYKRGKKAFTITLVNEWIIFSFRDLFLLKREHGYHELNKAIVGKLKNRFYWNQHLLDKLTLRWVGVHNFLNKKNISKTIKFFVTNKNVLNVKNWG